MTTTASKLGTRARTAGLSVVVLFVAALLWEAGARALSSIFVPPLSEVLVHIGEDWFGGPAYQLFLSDKLIDTVWPSIMRVVPSFVIGAVAAVVLGVAIGLLRPLRDTLYPLIHFLRSIPSAAKVPLFVVLLGIGDAMKMSVIAVAVAFPVLINTVEGVRSVEPALLDMCKVHRVPARKRVFGIVLPSASPHIFAGLRIGSAVALIVMIVVEMLAASDGIGYFVLYAQRQFRFLDMWAGLLLLAVFGYLLNLGLNLLERRALGWHAKARAGTGH
ncbi:ABC transporter permease [Saccharomonospora sp. NPDC006951]